MNKISTLVAAMALVATTASAERKQLTPNFSGWTDEVTVVDGKTLTFSGDWQGAGMDLLTHTGEGDDAKASGTDYSDYDYIVVKYKSTTCGFNVCLQFADAEGKIDSTGDTFPTITVSNNPGTLITGVEMGDNSERVGQIYIQTSTGVGTVDVESVYLATEEEWKADQEASKVKKLPFNLSTGANMWTPAPTFDAATSTLSWDASSSWVAWGWTNWSGGYDCSDFDAFVVEFAEPTNANGKLWIQDATGTSSEEPAGLFEADTKVAVLMFKDAASVNKAALQMIGIQAGEGASFKLKAAYACTESEIPAGIQAIQQNAAEQTDGAIYNLNGQSVSKSYKGLVIKNGKKYLVR